VAFRNEMSFRVPERGHLSEVTEVCLVMENEVPMIRGGRRSGLTRGNGVTTDFAYDVASRLMLISHKKPDGTGNRTAKTVNRRTERYLYDGDEILCDYDKNGSFAAMYVNGPIIDERLALLRDGELYYYLTDHLGSVRQLIDTAGNIKNSYDYEAYGSVHPEVEAAPNPAGFTGVILDRESSLLDYRWRKYSPTTGRFLQLDRERAGYAYCSNNPLRTRDPYGTGDEWQTKPPEKPPAKPDVEKPKDFKSQWQDPEDVWCAKQTGVARLLCRMCIRRILRLGGATVWLGKCQECYNKVCLPGCEIAYGGEKNRAYIDWCQYDCWIRYIACIGR